MIQQEVKRELYYVLSHLFPYNVFTVNKCNLGFWSFEFSRNLHYGNEAIRKKPTFLFVSLFAIPKSASMDHKNVCMQIWSKLGICYKFMVVL